MAKKKADPTVKANADAIRKGAAESKARSDEDKVTAIRRLILDAIKDEGHERALEILDEIGSDVDGMIDGIKTDMRTEEEEDEG